MNSQFTVTGTSPDDSDDETECAPLSDEQLAARNAAWPLLRFDPYSVGGADDGFMITSDADPGL